MMGLTEAKLFSANGILMPLIDSITKGRCCSLCFVTSMQMVILFGYWHFGVHTSLDFY